MPLSASSLLNRFTLRAKFRHMQILVSLAEFGSMRRAAQHLNMTQPAISQMVGELERLVETDLFLRHARGVSPTPAGQELVPAAQTILSTLGDAVERVTNELQEQGGVVRISASAAAVGALLHGRLIAFAERHPETQLQVTQSRHDNVLLERMEAPTDLILLRSPTVTPEGWNFVPCAPDRLTVVCHSSHPLASVGTAELRDLAKCTWLMHRVGSVARNRLEAAAIGPDWPELRLCRVNLHIPELSRDMLASGAYVTLLPESVMRPWIDTGEFIALSSPLTEPLSPLGFLWQPDRARPGVRKVAAFLEDHAQSFSTKNAESEQGP